MIDQTRKLGVHLTPTRIFEMYIFPLIESQLWNHTWIDLFAGKGNLIIPIIEKISPSMRNSFVKDHIRMFDIQPDMIKHIQSTLKNLNIDPDIISQTIHQQDTLLNYPKLPSKYPIFHITNPPYLYRGYISKHVPEHLKYFQSSRSKLQDLYQVALYNDMDNNVKEMIYIIPSNFLFGDTISNHIRRELLTRYQIINAILIEDQIFENTGQNVLICHFKRSESFIQHQTFNLTTISNNQSLTSRMSINLNNSFRGGSDFDEYVFKHKSTTPLTVQFYLMANEIKLHHGSHKITVINANHYQKNRYKIETLFVDDYLYHKIKTNPLFIRTIDSGQMDKRIGIYNIKEEFGVDAIVASKKYRTHPIQIFIQPELDEINLTKFVNYFNETLEHLRNKTNSSFLTTFKYSKSGYTRKFMGLNQFKKLIETFQI